MCDQGGQKKETPDIVSPVNNRRRVLNLVCLLSLVTPRGTSQFLVQFFVVIGFFKIHLFCYFLSQNTTELPAFKYATLSSFSIKYGWHRIQKWFMHLKQVHFVLSKQEELISALSIFPPFCSKTILVPRPRSFRSAPRIATSGKVQQRKSENHGLPVTLRMLRVKSHKSD